MKKRLSKKAAEWGTVIAIVILIFFLIIFSYIMFKEQIPALFDRFKEIVPTEDRICKKTGVTLRDYENSYREELGSEDFEKAAILQQQFKDCFPKEFEEFKFANDEQRYAHAMALRFNKDYDAAKTIFEDLEPYKESDKLVAIVFAKQGKYDEAIEKLKEIVKESNDQRKIADAKYLIKGYYFEFAQKLTDEKKYDEAIEKFKEYIKMEDNKAKKFEAEGNIIIILFKKHEIDKALKKYEELAKTNPDSLGTVKYRLQKVIPELNLGEDIIKEINAKIYDIDANQIENYFNEKNPKNMRNIYAWSCAYFLNTKQEELCKRLSGEMLNKYGEFAGRDENCKPIEKEEPLNWGDQSKEKLESFIIKNVCKE